MPRLAAAGIAKSLKARIESGEWADSKMPPERELAESFGVARNTVRRAIGMLSASVPISREVGRGTFFESSSQTSLHQIIARMEGSSPADMMEIRQLLEPTAAAFAATNASAGELSHVAEAHERASAATEMPDFEHWDAELHHRIFACSRNELLRDLHNILRVLRNQNPWFDMKKRSFSQERRENYCREHQVFVDALFRRDPDAAREAMRKHLRSVESNILGR